jgi:hypothetical protein
VVDNCVVQVMCIIYVLYTCGLVLLACGLEEMWIYKELYPFMERQKERERER